MRLGYTGSDISMLVRTDEVDCMSLKRRISVIPPDFRVFCATLCLFLIASKSIPGYMEAMTMSYQVADSISMGDLKEGDHIQADLNVARGKSYLQKITVVGSHPRPGGS